MRSVARPLVAAAALLHLGLGATPATIPLSTTVDRGSDSRLHVVPSAHADPTLELLINVPQRMLFRLDANQVTHAFPIAVGRASWPTPIAPFRVVSKEEHPTWDVPASIQEEMRRAGRRVLTRVPPGPKNPLGDYWIGTSLRGIGIHGTSEPSSISRFVSHGCIRLHPADVATLFPIVRLDASGLIVYEPVLMARTSGGIFVEAHPDAYRRVHQPALAALRETAAREGLDGRIDWTLVEQALKARDGAAHRVDVIE